MSVTIAGDGTLTGVDPVLSGFGKTLQVVQTVKTDTFSTTSTAFTAVTGLTAAITPSSNTSKVLIIAHINFGLTQTASAGLQFRLTGGNAGTFVGDAASNRIRTATHYKEFSSVGAIGPSVSIVYLDSPATTSATTYGVETRMNAGTVYVNRTGNDNDNAEYGRMASSITVIEVAA